jgi:hypothetical protein
MGFFKSIGTKLKRAISIKNLSNLATGNFSAVGQDLIRVATTEKVKDANGKVTIVPNGFSKTPVVLPEPVKEFLDVKGKEMYKKTTDALAKTDAAQNATDFVTTIALKSFWNKNKNYIIGLITAIILVVSLKMSFFGKRRKGGKRT